jgi:hypothetical protein
MSTCLAFVVIFIVGGDHRLSFVVRFPMTREAQQARATLIVRARASKLIVRVADVGRGQRYEDRELRVGAASTCSRVSRRAE